MINYRIRKIVHSRSKAGGEVKKTNETGCKIWNAVLWVAVISLPQRTDSVKPAGGSSFLTILEKQDREKAIA